MIDFAWIIRYPEQNANITHTYLKWIKKLQKYLSKVKHKQICNLFTQKTYKKGLCQFIFTVWILDEKIVLLFRKLAVKIAENPTVEIEHRLLQVIHIILLFIFNRFNFFLVIHFIFWEGF